MTELDYSGEVFSRLSASCIDFMKRMLLKDPTCRLSASEALQHPFITGRVTADIIVLLRNHFIYLFVIIIIIT